MRRNYTQKDIEQFFPDILDAIGREIPAFYTERECREFAVKIGWGACDIFRLDKRFERCYFAGKRYIHQTVNAGGVIQQTIDLPTGTYRDGNMEVVTIRKNLA